jgi:hypothetical protein
MKTTMKSFIAAVSDDYTSRMDDVADRLKNEGCEIKQILKLTGIITGKVKHTIDLEQLKVEGVKSIELQRKIRKS